MKYISRKVWISLAVFLLTFGLAACRIVFSDSFDRPDGPVGNGWQTWWNHTANHPNTRLMNNSLYTQGAAGSGGGIYRDITGYKFPTNINFSFRTLNAIPECGQPATSNDGGWRFALNANVGAAPPTFNTTAQVEFYQEHGSGNIVRRYLTPNGMVSDTAPAQTGQRDYVSSSFAFIQATVAADLSARIIINYQDSQSPAGIVVNFGPAVNASNAPPGSTFILGNHNCSAGPHIFDGLGIVDDLHIVRSPDTIARAGGMVSIPVLLDAEGTENGVGFSLQFNPAILTAPQVRAGRDLGNSSLVVNSNQAAQGRLGIVITRPAGQTFAYGVRELLMVDFDVATGATGSTILDYASQPVVREIVGVNAQRLDSYFVPATISIITGFEADVAPRPNGNGSVSVQDATMEGLFVAGLETPAPGSEFSRADCAPRNSLGDGQLTVADLAQTRLYAAGFAPLTPVGGPSAPASSPNMALAKPATPTARGVSVGNVSAAIGGRVTVTVSLMAQGDENALGFSLHFDPSALTNPQLEAANASVTPLFNTSQAAQGRLGVLLVLPAGQTFASGAQNLVNVTFNASISTAIGFGNQPIASEIVDVNANVLPSNYAAGNITVGNRPNVGFQATALNVGEGAGMANITVTRSGNLAVSTGVSYATNDVSPPALCSQTNGAAFSRCDYTTTAGLLNFAPGETAKTIAIPLTDDAYLEGPETFSVALSNFDGANIVTAAATFTIIDNDTGPPTANPVDGAQFFARQHYADFLNRAPDTAGLDYWTSQITQCGADANCVNQRRIGVSAAFFIELEFHETGFVVYRLYRAAFGTRLAPDQTRANVTYEQFALDRSQLTGGPGLAASIQAFAGRFVQRPAFLSAYPAVLTSEEFVNRLFDTASLNGSQFETARRFEIDAMNNQSRSRSQVLLNLINLTAFSQRERNPSFVLMQYFGYLRRDPDQGGYDFWLNILNQQPNNFSGMVCAFLTAGEYQSRFSSVITRTNAQCP